MPFPDGSPGLWLSSQGCLVTTFAFECELVRVPDPGLPEGRVPRVGPGRPLGSGQGQAEPPSHLVLLSCTSGVGWGGPGLDLAWRKIGMAELRDG